MRKFPVESEEQIAIKSAFEADLQGKPGQPRTKVSLEALQHACKKARKAGGGGKNNAPKYAPCKELYAQMKDLFDAQQVLRT